MIRNIDSLFRNVKRLYNNTNFLLIVDQLEIKNIVENKLKK